MRISPLVIAGGLGAILPLPGRAGNAAVLMSEFVFEHAPFRQCHAATIVETAPRRLAVAWFGGTREGNPDVGIWLARWEDDRWTECVEVATGVQPDGTREPTWNPVLFQPKEGPLVLFYKVGPTTKTWRGMLMTSSDGGRRWTAPRPLPDGILGPIKNKPVQLSDGSILCPSSTESPGRPGLWRIHFERTPDLGGTWTSTGPLNDGLMLGAIQPSILFHGGARLEALGRTRQGRIFEVWSDDNGKTWGPVRLTELPNPNAGIDAVTLADGRYLLVYNDTTEGRTPLNVAVSKNGSDWRMALVLEDEPGEYSYPAVIQAADGRVHITYTWRRERIKHVVLDPAQL
jgi:predicted neuraminidase